MQQEQIYSLREILNSESAVDAIKAFVADEVKARTVVLRGQVASGEMPAAVREEAGIQAMENLVSFMKEAVTRKPKGE